MDCKLVSQEIVEKLCVYAESLRAKETPTGPTYRLLDSALLLVIGLVGSHIITYFQATALWPPETLHR